MKTQETNTKSCTRQVPNNLEGYKEEEETRSHGSWQKEKLKKEKEKKDQREEHRNAGS